MRLHADMVGSLQWTNADGSHGLGRAVEIKMGAGVVADSAVSRLRQLLDDEGVALMRAWPGGELVLVRADDVKPYPVEPIPEPSDKVQVADVLTGADGY